MFNFNKPHKRLGIFSDIHSGSITGLTHYDNISEMPDFPGLADYRRSFFKWFKAEVKKYGPFDTCFYNGDCVDGPGKKGSIYTDTTNMEAQILRADAVIREIPTKKHIFIRGTGFHVATDKEHENELAARFKANIYDALTFTVHGVRVNMKHKGSRGGVPHSATPKVKIRLWDVVKEWQKGEEKSDITIRSHAHEYFEYIGNLGRYIQTPALQLPGYSDYGRSIDGDYNVGFMVMYVWPDGSYFITVPQLKFKIPNRKELRI